MCSSETGRTHCTGRLLPEPRRKPVPQRKKGEHVLRLVVAIVVLAAILCGPTYADNEPTFKFSGYAQIRYAGGERATPDQFVVRSVRPTFTGTLGTPLPISYAVQLEAAGKGGATVKLTDGFVNVSPAGWKLRAGQFKIPFGYDNPLATPKRLEPEPALVIDTLFPGLRDQGLFATFPVGATNEAKFIIGAVNGQGINSSDANDGKDLFVRLEGGKGKLHGGISAYTGKYGATDLDKNRFGADVQLTDDSLTILGEYVAGEGWHGPPPVQGYSTPGFKDKDFSGGYLSVYYQRSGSPHIVFARYDVFDPDTTAGGDYVKTTTVGYAHEIAGLNRVSLAYETRDDSASGSQGWIVGQLQIAWK